MVGSGVLRYFLVVALLIVISGVVFGSTLVDAYNYLTASGWSQTDALGFLGVSLLATVKLNPNVAIGAVAGALSGYILAKGVELGGALIDYINVRKGLALLGSFSNISNTGVVMVGPGQVKWASVYISSSYRSYDGCVVYVFTYSEYVNVGGSLSIDPSFGVFNFSKSGAISWSNWGYVKQGILDYLSRVGDREGYRVGMSFLSVLEGNWLGKNTMQLGVSRSLVADANVSTTTEPDVVSYVPASKPSLNSEDVQVGFSLLTDPARFYEWAREKFGDVGYFEKKEVDNVVRGYLEQIINTLQSQGVQNSEVYNKIQDLYSKITMWDSVQNEMLSKSNVIDEKLNSVIAGINDLREIVEQLQSGSGAGTVDVSEIIAKLEEVEGNLSGAITAVDEKVGSIKEGIESVEEGINENTNVLKDIFKWLQDFWDTLFEKFREFLLGEWFTEFVRQLYHVFIVPEDFGEIWSETVSGWGELVKFEVELDSKLQVSGNTVNDFNIPLGVWRIPVNIRSYIEMIGLRDLITSLVVASMWIGLLFMIVPRFVI